MAESLTRRKHHWIVSIGSWLSRALAHVATEAEAGQGRGRGGPEFPTEEQWSGNPEARRRVEAAMKIAGNDLIPQAKMFCTATGPQRMAVARQAAGLPPMPNYTVEPTRVFDNMYFIGMTSQNVWAITTSDGIILLDTLNSAGDEIVQRVGMNPRQPHEDARIVQVVLLQVIRIGVVLEEHRGPRNRSSRPACWVRLICATPCTRTSCRAPSVPGDPRRS